MAMFDTNAGKNKQPLSRDIDFTSIVQVSKEQLSTEDSPITFYCKRCKALTKVEKHPKKLLFKCVSCASSFRDTEVVFGTEKSLKNAYKIK